MTQTDCRGCLVASLGASFFLHLLFFMAPLNWLGSLGSSSAIIGFSGESAGRLVVRLESSRWSAPTALIIKEGSGKSSDTERQVSSRSLGYFTDKELDELPRPLYVPLLDREFMLSFPEEVRVAVLLKIDGDGNVQDVIALSGDPAFLQVVRDGFFRSKFQPAVLRGANVPAVVEMEVVFPALEDN